MTSTARIPAAEVTGLYGWLAKTMSRKILGQVPESLGVLWHHQDVLKDLMKAGRKAEGWDQVDPNLATFANMAVSAHVGCSFCLDLHYYLAHDHNLDEEKAREVPRWRDSDVFTPTERRVLAFAEAMSETPLTVTDVMVDELVEDLGIPAVIELSARIGMMNLTTRMNIALGIEAQGLSSACGLPPLAVAPDAPVTLAVLSQA
ncbi:AhpD family alkylhydroperoxidase [Mumia flava]|uniref:AhpD family alkylhydroperoxidase n=1 Tax=Mumia flava TaxID=1348852 RepID=A0A0B2B3J9_9ACTN|nr:carboxymuconolactone decarboxylase family protein [Mumia flava]PJJ53430.1 AhpD family alkylhydroperoxidase [Mumia flava]